MISLKDDPIKVGQRWKYKPFNFVAEVIEIRKPCCVLNAGNVRCKIVQVDDRVRYALYSEHDFYPFPETLDGTDNDIYLCQSWIYLPDQQKLESK